jgi:hypothetical protein
MANILMSVGLLRFRSPILRLRQSRGHLRAPNQEGVRANISEQGRYRRRQAGLKRRAAKHARDLSIMR